MESTCKNCVFWHQPEHAKGSEQGICRRFPPVPVARHAFKAAVPEDQAHIIETAETATALKSIVDTAWPCTLAGQWCGEHLSPGESSTAEVVSMIYGEVANMTPPRL